MNGGERAPAKGHLDVPVCYLVVVQVLEPLQDLARVEADGGLVVFEGAPLGPEQRRKAPWENQNAKQVWTGPFSSVSLPTQVSPPGTCSMKILMKPFSLMEPRY